MTVVERVSSLFPSLIEGDVETVRAQFCDEASVESPLGGRQLPDAWIRNERSWLCREGLTVQQVNEVAIGSRVAQELVVSLSDAEDSPPVTVLLIAQGEGGRIARLYASYNPRLVERLRADTIGSSESERHDVGPLPQAIPA